jgi:hypothetical protein
MARKSFNLTQDSDVDRWNEIKKQEINCRDNPNLTDVELFRDMMDHYEERDTE